MTAAPDAERQRLRQLLERELELVDSAEAAEAIVERLEGLAAGRTEDETGREAADVPGSAAHVVERVALDSDPRDQPAAVLAAAAAQAVAPTPEAASVRQAAREALRDRPSAAPSPPAAQRGRSYLREAVLRRMGPLQAFDARVYLLVNRMPHPHWLNAMVYAATILATGGWIWVIGVFVAFVFRVPRSWRALKALLPSLVGATWIVEYPIKDMFRRRRPFIEVLRAMVVGRKPGSFSFPSGHTASSFASAWVLCTIWPRRSPLFLALASFVGFSRVYVGAHYPGDVTAGAFFGAVLAEVIRRLVRRAFS